jgi:predicted membrane protein
VLYVSGSVFVIFTYKFSASCLELSPSLIYVLKGTVHAFQFVYAAIVRLVASLFLLFGRRCFSMALIVLKATLMSVSLHVLAFCCVSCPNYMNILHLFY